MDKAKLFGRRVRAVRRAAGVTQEEAAERAHLNGKYLGEIERGEKRPSFEVILTLARTLRTSPATFFDFDREEIDPKSLRKRINSLLQGAAPKDLEKIHRLVRALLEP